MTLLHRVFFSLAGLVVIIVLLAAAGSEASAGGGPAFNPQTTVAVDDPAPGAASDFTTTFSLPTGDVNFAFVISFIPQVWGVTGGDGIPINEPVGTLSASSTLGLVNGACNVPVPVDFDMRSASLDRTDTVSFLDTDMNGMPDFVEDKDGNGIADGIDHYPDFIDRILGPIQPIRRSAGITPVAGIPIFLQFLIFPPGTVISPALPSTPELGYPSVTLLQNIGDPEAAPAPGAITDFCTPLLASNTSFGRSPGDHVLFTNPAEAGTYAFNTIALGQRDADLDSYENALDTCPFHPNAGNPRVAGDGDADGDGLDAACDPNDNDPNSDQDNDGYVNRQDNCPLVANGTAQDNQKDSDRDQIGDACDPEPAAPNGDLLFAQVAATANIGVTLQGDADCNAMVNSVDALQILRDVAGLPTNAPCLEQAGDVNCDNERTSVDALQILRFVALLQVNTPPGCTPIGQPLT
jgi:hypothetical protein